MRNNCVYQTATLEGGLRLLYIRNAAPVVYCGFAIDAGSRDELPGEQGMAHYVEHMLFKGTTHRRAWHILNRMEAVGGDLNAFTNKEETMVYCAHLPQDLPRALELLADIVFHCTFPEAEMEREVEVIVDEIQSYEDSPAELIFDEFDGLLFPGHPLGRNILGEADELRRYRSEDLRRFVDRCYRKERMVCFVQGDVEFEKVKRLVEKACGAKAVTTETTLPTVDRQPVGTYQPHYETRVRDTHQAHVMLGARGFDAKDPRRTALYLLTNILGGPGMNSRLNVALRERSGLVYNVEANLTSYTDTGAFTIYFGCDKEDIAACRRLAERELRRLCEQPLTPAQLRAAKRQLIGQMGVGSDNYENLALDQAKVFLHYGCCEEREDVIRRIEAVTAEEMQAVAKEVFGEGRLSGLEFRE
jgi:predicted Zn-dependent peptidase